MKKKFNLYDFVNNKFEKYVVIVLSAIMLTDIGGYVLLKYLIGEEFVLFITSNIAIIELFIAQGIANKAKDEKYIRYQDNLSENPYKLEDIETEEKKYSKESHTDCNFNNIKIEDNVDERNYDFDLDKDEKIRTNVQNSINDEDVNIVDVDYKEVDKPKTKTLKK